jgi:signal transduction histidine kinase
MRWFGRTPTTSADLAAPPSQLRRPFLWMSTLAVLILAGFAAVSTWRQRATIHAQVRDDLTRDLTELVSGWEEHTRDQLDQWLDTAGASDRTTAGMMQERLRERVPWFDSLYVWRPPERDATTGRLGEARLLFPEPAPTEDPAIFRHPCVSRVRALSRLVGPPDGTIADAYVTQCARAPLAVRVYAAGEAAQLFHRIGRDEDALAALAAAGLANDLPIIEASALGVPPRQAVVHRLRTAGVLDELGRADEAIPIWQQLGLEIAELDAALSADVLRYDWEIEAELERHGAPQVAAEIRTRLSRAHRRARAWDEIQRRVITQPPPGTSWRRFAYDQYQDTPYVLYYGPIADGLLGGAIVLDQPTMLADLLDGLGELEPSIRITDATGEVRAGSSTFTAAAARVPLRSTLTHLWVEVDESVVAARSGRYGGQLLVVQVVVFLFAGVGLAGVAAQALADRRQQELLVRQREFTTRVTHELKTPLAGIRVMAENLEIGAYKDASQASDMARRIVAEADRLKQRVEEVLAVAKQDHLPDPAPFDPEDALLEAIDAWGPRLEEAGVALSADLDATDEIVGDRSAFRDAVGCLLDNALKYRRDDRNDAQVELRLSQIGPHIVVDVVDNGLGVPPKLRKAIFEPFVRVEGPNRGRSGGHGLGLAQVARVARQHGGTVTCGDGLDGGAAFQLRIPARAPAR